MTTSLSLHNPLLRAVLCWGAALLGGCLAASRPASREPQPASAPAGEVVSAAGAQAGEYLALGASQQETGHPAKALELYQKALSVSRERGDGALEGRALYGIGYSYFELERTDEALDALSLALPLRRRAGDVIGEIRTLTVLGQVYEKRGSSERAKETLYQALELTRSPAVEDLELKTRVFQILAGLLAGRGEVEEALQLYLEARALSRRIENQELEAYVLQHLGEFYRALGEPQEALTNLHLALDLSRKVGNGDLEAATLVSIGFLHLVQEDPQQALRFCSQALSLDPKLASALRCLGRAHVAERRPAEGLEFLSQALSLSQDRPPAQQARIRLDMAVAHTTLGQLEQAGTAFQKVLEVGRQPGNPGLQVSGLFEWAKLDRSQGRLQEALKKIREALDVIESVRTRVPDEKLRTSFFASKRDYYELYMNLLMELDERHPGAGYRRQALEASEQARVRSLLDLLSEGRVVEKGVDADLKKREVELEAQLSWVQETLSQSATTADPETVHWQQLRSVQDQLEKLQQEIRNRHPRYASVRFPQPLRVDEVRGLLDERTALLEYFLGQEASFLFVVTREGLETFHLPPAPDLAAAVSEVRSRLEDSGSSALAPYREKAFALYSVLLGPAARTLARKTNLLIAPDRSLYFLPFEALLTREEKGPYKNLPYLLRTHTLSYVPSASVLEELRAPREETPAGRAAKEFLAFADPVYELPGETEISLAQEVDVKRQGSPRTWSRLTHSREEVQEIARLYPEDGVQLYLRELASKKNVFDNPLLEWARRIHFATHGYLNEAKPQFSALVLSRDTAGPDDDLLQVYEIFNLSLHADLLVLSACETGGGQEVAGEGMLGLTRAFLYAGARSLVVSLWPISDRSTPEIMVRFYKHLEEGESKPEALRKAKLELIEGGYSRPAAWAPFVLTGDFH